MNLSWTPHLHHREHRELSDIILVAHLLIKNEGTTSQSSKSPLQLTRTSNINSTNVIMSDLIKRAGQESQGSAGPSWLNTEAWKPVLTYYEVSLSRLCTALSMAPDDYTPKP